MITKPGIAVGVAAAALAGMVLANRGLPGMGLTLLALSSTLMAASGSAILNVLLERDTDALMPRVAGRAKALERLGPGKAFGLSLGLIVSALVLSCLFINPFTAFLILAASLSYVLLYTLLLKRSSPYGTVAGGIPGALPVLIGYASVRPDIRVDGVILFLVMLLWQPPHFLALALKYKDEYEAAGLPVMPVTLGEPYTKAFLFLYAVALLPLTVSLWALGFCSGYFAGFALAAGLLFLSEYFLDVVVLKRYGRAFGASIVYIIAVLTGVVLDVGMAAFPG